MDMPDLKAEVRRFWDAAACGEIYAEGRSLDQQFRQHAEARYRLEPYIRDFARFQEGRGRDVLEVGVGMGADHLEWARNGPRRLAGVDLTPRALAWTTQRLGACGSPPSCGKRTPSASPSRTSRSTSSTRGACSTTRLTRHGPSGRPTAYSGRVAPSAP
jgi:hypothetical protein